MGGRVSETIYCCRCVCNLEENKVCVLVYSTDTAFAQHFFVPGDATKSVVRLKCYSPKYFIKTVKIKFTQLVTQRQAWIATEVHFFLILEILETTRLSICCKQQWIKYSGFDCCRNPSILQCCLFFFAYQLLFFSLRHIWGSCFWSALSAWYQNIAG